jgi:uncharacterized membrane protein YphA (DoxX/SURF4 family)
VVSTLALIVRLVLAAVFAVAGTAKLADLQGSRGAVEGFGVPSRFAAAGGTILPLVELSIATGLLVGASARWAGACAIALLALFAVAMARSIARGDAPDCHCFGALHSRPVGKATLARTVGLGALAVFAVAQGPGTSATAWVGRLHGAGAVAAGAGVAAAVLVVIGGWVAVELLRAHGRLLQRVDALEAALAQTGIAASVSASNGHGETPGLPVGTPPQSSSYAMSVESSSPSPTYSQRSDRSCWCSRTQVADHAASCFPPWRPGSASTTTS